MYTFFFKKNKKGAIEAPTEETIMLIFGAVTILVLLASFMYPIFAALLSEPDDGSIANLKRLYSKIIEVIEHPNFIAAEETFNYFIEKDKILVALDTNGNENKLEQNVIILDPFRPSECENDACICLYKLDKLGELEPKDWDKAVITCEHDGLSDKNIVFDDSSIDLGKVQEISIFRIYDETTKTYHISINRI